MSEQDTKLYYVEIATNSQGEAVVKVSCSSDTPLTVDYAFGIYTETIQTLRDNGIAVASAHVDTKITNENSKFLPQVTASGRDHQVVDEYLKVKKEVEA